MIDLQYFGQINSLLPNNPAIAFPVNSPAGAANYINAVNESIPSNRVQYGVRRMLRWMVPERGIIEMYINPQSLRFHKSKAVRAERTKGGFVVQYWGEELIVITISGHTGTSGIEGINVLDQVYRSEQIAFDVIAIESLAKSQNDDQQFLNSLIPGFGELTDFLGDLGEETQGTGLAIPKPTLGFYATTVEMYWMGEVYRGFFESMDVTESATNLGIFDYNITFKATQKRGIRRNYLPWQHTAMAGPSDHTSVPFTFSGNSLSVGAGQTDPNLLKQQAANLATRGRI